MTGATDDFLPLVGSQATFNLPIRWTGSDSSVHLLDVLPGVGGPAWTVPIVGASGFATATFFSLQSVTFDEDSLTLIGRGTTQLISGDPLVLQHSAARIVIQGIGQDFTLQPYRYHDFTSGGRVRTWPPRDWLGCGGRLAQKNRDPAK